jgi:hypothetical protein
VETELTVPSNPNHVKLNICKSIKNMKTKLLILLAVLGISSNSFSEEPIDLFIWAGQSNAQGWEGDANFFPPDPDGLDSQIRLNYTFRYDQ